MPFQRACDAVNQVRNKLSNGPLRVQSNVFFTKYSATCGHTSVAGGMSVPYKEHWVIPVNSRWHRGFIFVLDREFCSVGIFFDFSGRAPEKFLSLEVFL